MAATLTYTTENNETTTIYTFNTLDDCYNKSIEVYQFILYLRNAGTVCTEMARSMLAAESTRDMCNLISRVIVDSRVRQIDVSIGGGSVSLYNSHIDGSLLRMCYAPFVRQLGEVCHIRPEIRQVREELAALVSHR
jgi:hypothetical protein